MSAPPAIVEHESAHRAAAEMLGLEVTSVSVDGAWFWDDGVMGQTRIVPGPHDPLVLSVVAYMPAVATLIGWEDSGYDGDRRTLELLMPTRHLHPDIWTAVVRDRARELVQSDEYRWRFASSVAELERLGGIQALRDSARRNRPPS